MILMFSQCRKNQFIFDSSADLDFSTDTVLFDTVFTTIGSTTKYFKIYNNNNGKIKIDNIWLAGGINSPYRINVDGEAGVNFESLELESNDSLFIFVEVTVDPNNSSSPLVVQDSIMFSTNGNEQKVILNAWGQDAYFHVKEIITANETWNNDKPHVIYNYCAVDSAVKLTIPAGTTVHGHNNSYLLVYKGSLDVMGSPGQQVTFMQDRLADYLLYPADSVAGQWRGLYFFEAQNSTIQYADIKNAVIGIQVDTNQTGQFVNLEQVRVDNSLYAGILTQGGNVNATNCLFGNTGTYSASLTIGGDLNFDHCTFGCYWSGQRNTALFGLKDYYESGNTIQYRPFDQANFTNCIVYGQNENEFILDTLDRVLSGVPPVFSFANCLIKTENGIQNANYFTSCWVNTDPGFVDPYHWDYHVPSGGFVDGKAAASSTSIDLEGNGRSNGTLGCFESN